MSLHLLLLILSLIFLLLSVVPKASRGWMLAVGLALFVASFLPGMSYRLVG